jgi:beta-ketoacyl synthase-like protein
LFKIPVLFSAVAGPEGDARKNSATILCACYGLLARIEYYFAWGRKLGRWPVLRALQWAAIRVSDGVSEEFGQSSGEAAIPPALRRRMGRLERLAARCALGVLETAKPDELIFCSRYGNIETMSALLQGMAEGQMMSPMAFSGSVHNATPGLIGQIRHERLAHTAVAAGLNTLIAGVAEACARLAQDECSNVVVIFADLPLPDHFHEFEDEALPGLALAMRMELTSAGADNEIVVIEPGRRGALAVLERLKQGATDFTIGEAPWPKHAA